MHEKDPFGDKLKDKERGEEEQYFAKRERALLSKLRGDEASRGPVPRENSAARCPKCGGVLTTSTVEDTRPDTCSNCPGLAPVQNKVASASGRLGQHWLARLLPRSLDGTR